MAHHKCELCDYTEEDGSPVTCREPSPHNRVFFDRELEQWLCTECSSSIHTNIFDLSVKDATEEEEIDVPEPTFGDSEE